MTQGEEIEFLLKNDLDISALQELNPDSFLIKVWESLYQVIGSDDEVWTILLSLDELGIRLEANT